MVCSWILKFHNSLYFSESRTGSGSWSYQFAVLSKPHFSLGSKWTTWTTLSCLHDLYWFCASAVHSATRWLTVSALSPHILHVRENFLILQWFYTVCTQILHFPFLASKLNTWLFRLQQWPNIVYFGKWPNFKGSHNHDSLQAIFSFLPRVPPYVSCKPD